MSSLLPGESPRLDGQDEAHITRLAEIETSLPPILVDRHSMEVIDGRHRFLAALVNGRATIDVIFFDGTRADAFLRAVETNVAHGFPLSLADRRAAVVRILVSHPHMSDRMIADVAGLGSTTVATIRHSSTATAAVPVTRIGKDGKTRPLDGFAGRQRAAVLITAHPGDSLREVARGAGVSLATASDVRKRLDRGEEPMQARPAAVDSGGGSVEPVLAIGRPARPWARVARSSIAPVLEKLRRDPALRYSETGRQLLRLLQCNAAWAREWSDLLASVPQHSGELVGQLARQYAQMWVELAEKLDERIHRLRPVAMNVAGKVLLVTPRPAASADGGSEQAAAPKAPPGGQVVTEQRHDQPACQGAAEQQPARPAGRQQVTNAVGWRAGQQARQLRGVDDHVDDHHDQPEIEGVLMHKLPHARWADDGQHDAAAQDGHRGENENGPENPLQPGWRSPAHVRS